MRFVNDAHARLNPEQREQFQLLIAKTPLFIKNY